MVVSQSYFMVATGTISSKGQLVVPKAIREKLQWASGTAVEMLPCPAGMIVREIPRNRAGLTADEAIARIRARSPYRGPALSDGDIDAAVAAAVAKKYRG